MAASPIADRVLVTGASGFIAAHIVQLLLQEGYKVRGTVRSLENEEKVKPLRSLCPSARFPLELVEADLLESECWKTAVKDCDYVMHVASVVPTQTPEHEDNVIKPAVEGTLHVLQACQSSFVKRVVITSSIAAVASGPEIPGHIYTEIDWTDPDSSSTHVYTKSKTLAEKAAWDYVQNISDGNNFEFSVINPGLVFGPVLSGSYTASMSILKKLLERAMLALPSINFEIVDVRDLAQAHLNAMRMPEAAGHRHIVTAGRMWLYEIALVIKKEFEPQGYGIPTTVAPKFLFSIIGLFNKDIRWILPMIGVNKEFGNSRMKNVLKIEPIDLKTSIVDMCYSMIENGFVKKTDMYKGASSKI